MDKESIGAAEYAARRERLRRRIASRGLDALFVLNDIHRRYLTGFQSSAGILIILPDAEPLFFTDFRYLEMARQAIQGIRLQGLHDQTLQLRPLAQRLRLQRAGYEGSLAVGQWKRLQEAMPSVETWEDCETLILDLRMVKSTAEQALIRKSVRLCDCVFRQVAEEIAPGMSEWDIRKTLRGWVDRLDAEGESFESIISAGSNSSKPHAHVSRDVWKSSQALLIDTGVRLNGYCSDMTRMVFAAPPKGRMRSVYDIVLTAQLKALDAIRPGKTGRQVDAVARQYIEKKGFGKQFGHGLGHGVGLEIHENPRLNQLGEQVLQPGMVVTVEPGIYLPGIGGVRIEDMVIVRRDGCEILTQTTKDIILAG